MLTVVICSLAKMLLTPTQLSRSAGALRLHSLRNRSGEVGDVVVWRVVGGWVEWGGAITDGSALQRRGLLQVSPHWGVFPLAAVSLVDPAVLFFSLFDCAELFDTPLAVI